MKDIEKNSTAKLRRFMKLCATQGMIALMVCGVSMAHDNYAQLLDKEITLSLRGVTFENALKEIEGRSVERGRGGESGSRRPRAAGCVA